MGSISRGLLLFGRNSQSNLLAIWPFHKGSILLGRCQPCRDVPKGNGIRPHAKHRAPFLGNSLCKAGNTSLSKCIVELPSVAMHARRRRDVDNAPRSSVLHAEVRSRGADEGEGCGAVQGDDGIPLLVRHLVDDAVPSVAGVVDDDVDLSIAKVGGALDESVYIVCLEDVSRDSDGLAAIGLDTLSDSVALV